MNVTVTAPDPHCRAWVKAHASLWGNVKWHDLDEPVMLTEPIPCRVRLEHADCGDLIIIVDRDLDMKTIHAGTHVVVQFKFGKGPGLNIPIRGLNHVDASTTMHIDRIT